MNAKDFFVDNKFPLLIKIFLNCSYTKTISSQWIPRFKYPNHYIYVYGDQVVCWIHYIITTECMIADLNHLGFTKYCYLNAFVYKELLFYECFTRPNHFLNNYIFSDSSTKKVFFSDARAKWLRIITFYQPTCTLL